MRPVRRLLPRTVRGRVVAVVVLCLIVCCAAVAAATTLALRGFLLNRLDQQLEQAGNRYALELEHPGDSDADNSRFSTAVGQAAGTLGARIAGGTVTAVGIVGAGRAPSAEVRERLAGLQPGTRTIHLPDLGDYRVLVTRGRDGDLLVTGLPEHPVDETIVRLLSIEAAVFAVALLVTGLAAAGFVRLSLRPLTRVAQRAREVAALPLSSGTVSVPEPVDDLAPGTEVGEVALAFNRMLEHVETALNVRERSEERLRGFIADAGHELRTPVAVVRSHAEFAQRVAEPVPPEVERSLERIVAESDRMALFVDELLTLARLDAERPLAREPVDLTRLLLDAVADARVAGPSHRWRLDLPEEPVEVTGDEHTLHQAVANLLANARTHTPAGTTVTVGLRLAPEGDVAITVRDDGPGIPEDLLSRIFDRFVHGTDPAGGASSGSGLGLSIVAAIAAAHRGSVDVDSRPGRTEFRLRLPVD